MGNRARDGDRFGAGIDGRATEIVRARAGRFQQVGCDQQLGFAVVGWAISQRLWCQIPGEVPTERRAIGTCEFASHRLWLTCGNQTFADGKRRQRAKVLCSRVRLLCTPRSFLVLFGEGIVRERFAALGIVSFGLWLAEGVLISTGRLIMIGSIIVSRIDRPRGLCSVRLLMILGFTAVSGFQFRQQRAALHFGDEGVGVKLSGSVLHGGHPLLFLARRSHSL